MERPNFDDMFDRVSGDSERRRVGKAEQERREKEARDAQYARDKDALIAKVMPVLEDAKRRFEAKGVPVIIADNWSTIPRLQHPEIQFCCDKGDQPNKWGGKYNARGRSAFFSIRNGNQVGLGKYAGHAVGSETLKGDDEEIIYRAIEQALSSYFEAIEEGER